MTDFDKLSSNYRLVICKAGSFEQARTLVERLVSEGFDRDQISVTHRKGVGDISPSGSDPLDPARLSGTLTGTLAASGDRLIGNSTTVDTVEVDIGELLSQMADDVSRGDPAERETGIFVGVRGLKPQQTAQVERIVQSAGILSVTNIPDTGFRAG